MLLSASVSGLEPTRAKSESIFVEFLWAPTPEGALARQPTRGFLLDGTRAHQVCVAAIHAPASYRELRIDTFDAVGRRLQSQREPDFRGKKSCYTAKLDPQGEPGVWTFEIWLDEALRSTQRIEVARTLEDAEFHRPSGVPYVLGRPNYDEDIPPDAFVGRLVWVMEVDADGRVTRVEIESAEGAGERLSDRAMAAGWLSLFPPDPARTLAPLRYRRELKFEPD